ncbi:expressed unknown protein [Seminavis robusta]|uniref:RING-type domain-containing protein n=1 Tax=Seminavis robusta TaxID=568900 RepID=A0A9N8E7R1_9STRA|nr:expressed unknown protein [Seminavis robusta]|eukprot:Sro760_g198360.1 n/a (288) ;mRNA; f:19720-20683
MSTELQLIPIHSTTHDVLTDRATLTLEDDTAIVYLGDNDETEIVDPTLSSKVVKIYTKRNKSYAYCIPDAMGVVQLNGISMIKGARCAIKVGDILALRSSSSSDDDEDADSYSYRLEQPNGTPAAASGNNDDDQATTIESDDAGAAASTEQNAAAPAASLPKEIGEETMCPICMEIMVEPRTVVPCGHTFCRQCLTQQTECAECRGPLTGQVVCRPLQNLIEQLVQNGSSVFDQEDVESYKQRTQKDGAAANNSDNNNNLSRKRRRRQAARANRRNRAPQVIVCLDD